MRRLVLTAFLLTTGFAPSLAQETSKPASPQDGPPREAPRARILVVEPSPGSNSKRSHETLLEAESSPSAPLVPTPQEALRTYVHGVTSQILRGQGPVYRLSTPDAAPFGLVNIGHDPFGAALAPVDSGLRIQLELPENQGLVVLSLQPGGPAEQVGLKPNDIVMTLGKTPISTEESWIDALSALGEKSAPLNVIRKGEPLEIMVRARNRVSLAPIEEATNAETKPDYYIGIYTNPVDEVLRSHLGLSEDQGLVVQSVMENSPAAKAGLLAGDILLAAKGGSDIKTVEQLNSLIQTLRETPTDFKIMRNRSVITLLITPVLRPREETQAREDTLGIWSLSPIADKRLTGHVVVHPGHPDVRVMDLDELRSSATSFEAPFVVDLQATSEIRDTIAATREHQEKMLQELDRLIEIQSRKPADSLTDQIEALTRQVEALRKAVVDLQKSLPSSRSEPDETP